MIDLQYCIENFHKPRMAKLAEFLLNESEFPYDYFEPPTFETYMAQIKLSEELILSINYFPIEVTDEAPYLFLQLHTLLGELDGEPSADLYKYLSLANNNTELSAFHVDDGKLYIKSVLVEDPLADLDIARISFVMRIFYNNLMAHVPVLKSLLAGASLDEALDSE